MKSKLKYLIPIILGLIFLFSFFKPSLWSTYSSPSCNSTYICDTHAMFAIEFPFNTPEWIKSILSRPKSWSGGSAMNKGPWTYSYTLETTEWYSCENMCEDL